MKCTIERDYRQMGGGFLGHWTLDIGVSLRRVGRSWWWVSWWATDSYTIAVVGLTE